MDDNIIKEEVLSTFENVALAYDKVEFFKISSKNIKNMSVLKTGDNVLDVACGTGNVVLNFAQSFPKVSFTGLDISQAMLSVAEATARTKGLENIRFVCEDLETFQSTDTYELITCSYALFFLPNPIDTLKKLVSLLSQDGELIFTSFTENAFSPAKEILIDELKSFNIGDMENKEPWKELSTEDDIETLCDKSDIKITDIMMKKIRYPLFVEQWWDLKMSTGYRGLIDKLDENQFKSVKDNYFSKLQKHVDKNNQVTLIADTYYTCIKKT